VTPVGSNASPFRVIPWVLCIVLAHANCIGNFFRIVICDLFLGVAFGFAIHSIGVHAC
jgi:hypothetical protein